MPGLVDLLQGIAARMLNANMRHQQTVTWMALELMQPVVLLFFNSSFVISFLALACARARVIAFKRLEVQRGGVGGGL